MNHTTTKATATLLAVLLLLTSCRPAREIVREIPVEVPVIHTVYKTDTVKETHYREIVKMVDTAKRDTVTLYIKEYRDRYHATHDTIRDTVPQVVTVKETITETSDKKSPLTKWHIGILAALLAAVPVLLRFRRR